MRAPELERFRLRFVQRFQQLSGPATAKGVEDTAFYVYTPLLSRNEVGGGPRRRSSARSAASTPATPIAPRGVPARCSPSRRTTPSGPPTSGRVSTCCSELSASGRSGSTGGAG